MIFTVVVPVEEALDYIEIKSRKAVIYLECDGKASWVRSLGEVRPTQNVDKWVDWLINPPLEEEVTNIKWIIAVFHGSKKNNCFPS